MHEKISISRLLASKQPKAGGVFFIGVDGHAGSGKSTFAQWLAEKLHAQIVRTDDFASWDNLLNWWPLMIEHVFQPIQNGAKTLCYPRSQWLEHHFPKPVVDQLVTEIMIVDGISSLRKEFHEYVSLGFFVDTPKELCLKRGMTRDSETHTSPEELKALWGAWFDAEDVYIERDHPKEYADFVIDGTKPIVDQIE